MKHSLNQKGIGEPLPQGDVPIAGSWNAQMVDEFRALMRDDDVRIEKVRMNGFIGTPLDQVLRTQGIGTLLFSGVNRDECVATTMEEASFRVYNCVLDEDACATSSPEYCRQSVVFNATYCWGFSTTTARFAALQLVGWSNRLKGSAATLGLSDATREQRVHACGRHQAKLSVLLSC